MNWISVLVSTPFCPLTSTTTTKSSVFNSCLCKIVKKKILSFKIDTVTKWNWWWIHMTYLLHMFTFDFLFNYLLSTLVAFWSSSLLSDVGKKNTNRIKSEIQKPQNYRNRSFFMCHNRKTRDFGVSKWNQFSWAKSQYPVLVSNDSN